MAVKLNVPDAVREILVRATITADRVELPPEQLDRKLYEAVNKVLVAAGGKWDRRARAHLFTRDPRDALGLAIESGAVEHRKNTLQAFYTPTELADWLVQLASLQPGERVLEPSCGAGAIVAAVFRLEPRARVDGFDIDEDAVRTAASSVRHNWNFLVIDFLSMRPEAIYDVVVMNPPFAKDQDIEHVLHAWDFVRPGGRLISIMSVGWTSPGRSKKRRAFKEFVDERGEVHEIEAGAFKESGAMVRTVAIVLHKPSEP